MARESIRQRLERQQAEWRPGMPKPRRSVRTMFASTVLVLQALAVAFATLAMIGLYRGSSALPWLLAGGAALAVALVACCAVLQKPWGVKAGWALQILTFALGIAIPLMLIVAAGFTGCWIYALVKGRQIDAENAERDRLEAEYRREHPEEFEGGDGTP